MKNKKIDQLKFENEILENRIKYCVDFSTYIIKNDVKMDVVKFCDHLISVFRPPAGSLPVPREFHYRIPPNQPNDFK